MNIKDTWLTNTPIAHRGLHNSEYPENSMPAFKNAIENGYPIELDVHLSTDNKILVFHDETLIRMTGKEGKITSLSSSDITNYNLNGTSYTIPTLQELLTLVNGQVPILIEIKNTGSVGNLEKQLLNELSNYSGQIAIQSFNPYSVEYFKINAPNIPRGLLSMTFTKKEVSSFIKRLVLTKMYLLKKCDPHFIAYDVKSLPNKKLAKYNMPILAWTVTSKDLADNLKPYYDNIIFEQFIPAINK